MRSDADKWVPFVLLFTIALLSLLACAMLNVARSIPPFEAPDYSRAEYRLQGYIPEEYLSRIQLTAKSECPNPFRHDYQTYLYSCEGADGEAIAAALRGDAQWRRLPMLDSEYRKYVMDLCGWAVEDFDYLKGYELTEAGCQGFWRCETDPDHKKLATLLFFLEDTRTIISVFVC